MTSAGILLRQTRESLGVPLDEVARATHIREDYLLAIEADEYSKLPGEVYTRGFLRNYSAYLGLSPTEILDSYDRRPGPARKGLFGGVTPPAPPSQPRRPAPIRIEPLSPTPIDTRVRYAPSFWLMGSLVFVLLLASYLGYTALSGVNRGPLPTPTTVAGITPTELREILPTVIVSQTPVWTPLPTPSGVVIGNAPPTPPPLPTLPGGTPAPTGTPFATGPGVAVDVRIGSQNAWMRVDVDGKTQFTGTLAAGTIRSWTARSTIRIRTARADLVQVTVNGTDRGRMSDSTQLIMTKEWDTTGTERIIP